MVKSSIIALSIFTFVGAWNNFLWPMVSCSKQEMKTLPLALGMMKTLYNIRCRSDYGMCSYQFPATIYFLCIYAE